MFYIWENTNAKGSPLFISQQDYTLRKGYKYRGEAERYNEAINLLEEITTKDIKKTVSNLRIR